MIKYTQAFPKRVKTTAIVLKKVANQDANNIIIFKIDKKNRVIKQNE